MLYRLDSVSVKLLKLIAVLLNVSALRSGEFKHSARAFSVHHVCILNLSFLKGVGVLGSFCPWLNCTAPSRERCCLAYSLSSQRIALDVMVKIPAMIFIEPAG